MIPIVKEKIHPFQRMYLKVPFDCRYRVLLAVRVSGIWAAFIRFRRHCASRNRTVRFKSHQNTRSVTSMTEVNNTSTNGNHASPDAPSVEVYAVHGVEPEIQAYAM